MDVLHHCSRSTGIRRFLDAMTDSGLVSTSHMYIGTCTFCTFRCALFRAGKETRCDWMWSADGGGFNFTECEGEICMAFCWDDFMPQIGLAQTN